MRRVLTAILLATAALPAVGAPKVAATIAPVHSLVAQVMAGVGTPELLIPPTASEHDHALRPSEAALLEAADLVFTVGAGLEGGIADAVETLAAGARIVTLADVPGLTRLAIREGALFEGHAHDHGPDAAEDHAHDHDHDEAQDHDHENEARDHGGGAHAAAGHDGAHAHGHNGAEDHAGWDHGAKAHAEGDDRAQDGAIDPHFWLDPVNARLWLDAIAAALAETDPANAAAYRANATDARRALSVLEAGVAADIAPVRGRPFIVFHDAYHYFEHRFGIEAAGAVALNDATMPGPQRLAALRARLADAGAACVFAEPQFPDRILASIVEGTGARTGTLDPIGATLTPGPDLYAGLIRGLAGSLTGCLGAGL